MRLFWQVVETLEGRMLLKEVRPLKGTSLALPLPVSLLSGHHEVEKLFPRALLQPECSSTPPLDHSISKMELNTQIFVSSVRK